MLDKLIIIENNEDYKFNSFEDIVKYFIDNNYYDLSSTEKENIIMKKAIDISIENGLKIIKNKNEISNLNESFIAIDEMSVILSILKNQTKIILLERKDSKIFNKYINQPRNDDNYIIINTFAIEALENYLSY